MNEPKQSSLLELALRQFANDLPELVQSHQGQWVACHGRSRLKFDDRKTPLYQWRLGEGYRPGEFLVRCVEPHTDCEIVGMGLMEESS